MRLDKLKRRRNTRTRVVRAATATPQAAAKEQRRFDSGAAHRDEGPLAFRLLIPVHPMVP